MISEASWWLFASLTTILAATGVSRTTSAASPAWP